MKTWIKPSIETLGLEATAQGKQLSNKYDEIRVDQNGNYWAGFSSGADSKPSVSGEVEVK